MSIKGYKVFNPDWTCRGFQYEVGKTYKHEGNIGLCKAGFHFCQKIVDCFNYYDFNNENKVAEVEAIGLIETENDKSVTDEIRIVREISWIEMLTMANEGKDCTGLRNTGNWNTGNRNTGNWNTGNRNTGNRNTGNCNTGDWNTGNCNTGLCNTGLCNTGDCNTGDRNTGDCNTGNRNTGDCNTGDCNTGLRNTGDCNTGDWNTGNRNTGNWNTGDCNTGNWNTGDCNTGNWNTGDWNTGNWNKTNFSSGFFNTIAQPIYAFNKELSISRDEFYGYRGVKVLNWNFEDHWWIYSDNMTEKEKQAHPEYITTGGYLKVVDFKTACKMMWDGLDDNEKQAVRDIPNFDANVFEEITGIKI